MKRWIGILLVIGAACASSPREPRLVERTAEALGGVAAVRAVRTLSMEGEGESYSLGQGRVPGDELPRFLVTGYTRTVDLEHGRWRVELQRQRVGSAAEPQRVFQAVDGQYAFDVSPDGVLSRFPEREALNRRIELLHSPAAILRAALAPDAEIGDVQVGEGVQTVSVGTATGESARLTIDSATHLPARVSSLVHHDVFGDVELSTEFGDYVPANGLRLPRDVVTRVDGVVVSRLRLGSTRIDVDASHLVVPPPVASTTPTTGGGPVPSESLADGVWLLTGGTHHSVLVELDDQAVLIEAPVNEARTSAVIAAARALVSAKPLRRVINTHHHADHAGGLRTAIAEGMIVLTADSNRPFVEALAARPHTLLPDRLAQSPREPELETVAGDVTLGAGARRLLVVPMEPNAHAVGMLVVHVPAARLLVQADLFTPGRPAPLATALLEAIRGRRLPVERIVPLHGEPVPLAELEAAARGPE